VNSIEDGARAAMQAVAGSITDAPPLRLDPVRLALPRPAEAREADDWAPRTLPPAAKRPARVRRGTGRMRRHRAWLAPLAAAAVIVAIALQAFIAAQLGLALGAKIAELWRERAERLAGVALILLGIYLIAEQLTR